MDEKFADVGLAVGIISLVVVGLGSSVVASILRFDLIHNAIETIGQKSIVGSSFDTLTISALGLSFSDTLAVLWTILDIMWLAWLVRNW